jgi:nitrogen fixation NifU-like protein
MDPLYREIILENWQNPQNYGVVEKPDIDVEDFNLLCGDMIHLTGKRKNGKLIEIAFTGEGCAISKASASLFTEEIKGKSFDSLKKIKEQDLLDLLEIELTPARIKCALLVYKALRKSL